MIAIVVSHADSASEQIGEQLLDAAEWTPHEDDTRPGREGGGRYYRRPGFEYRTFEALHLELDDVADAFRDPNLLVFVSRHAGETGPLLSAHFTGNFGPAEYGGRDGELARAAPNAQKAVVAALAEHAPAGYEVGIECTHHGPSSVGAPSMFVELGSGPAEWDDPEGARAVARAVLDLDGVAADRRERDGGRADDASSRTRHVVGFGGGHYAPRFGRIVAETDWAVGHVGADWPLEAMGDPADSRAVVERAFEQSAADLAVVDGDYPALERVVEELGYRVVNETYLRVTDGVPRSLVDALEADLSAVESGLRFGTAARGASADGEQTVDSEQTVDGEYTVDETDRPYAVRPFPTELLGTAFGIDADATRDAVAGQALAFETTENGTRPTGRIALPREEAYADVVAGLCVVLEQRYDAVDREGEAVVARETAFDPAAARERGVEEGPAFGRLSRGDPVEIDGETVDPESVHRERTDRFPV